MLIGTLHPDGTLSDQKTIDQSQLTSDCWLIQFNGLIACKTCEAYGSEDCGGGATLKAMNAEAGQHE
jgi:hypothetical protein